jgi:hypothetical protein
MLRPGAVNRPIFRGFQFGVDTDGSIRTIPPCNSLLDGRPLFALDPDESRRRLSFDLSVADFRATRELPIDDPPLWSVPLGRFPIEIW